MPMPLGEKSRLIREAIRANPDLSNKELAEKLNGAPDRAGDRFKFSANDVGQQRQRMKALVGAAEGKGDEPAPASQAAAPRERRRRSRPPGRRKKAAPAPPAAGNSSAGEA